MRTSVQLDEWARAVVDASPPLDSEDRRIMIATFRLLAEGEPVSEPQVAEQTGLTLERVEASMREWPLVIRDDRDRVIGFWGMHAYRVEPTHAMTHDETNGLRMVRDRHLVHSRDHRS